MTRSSVPRIVNVRPKMVAPAVRTGALAQLLGGYSRSLPKRGTRETLNAFKRSPVLRSIAHKIALAEASIEYWTEVETADGWQVVDEHHLTNFMTRGTWALDGMQTRIAESLHLLLVGDAFSAIEYNALGMPMRRFPLPGHWCHEVPLTEDGIFRFVPVSRQPFTLARKQVLWRKEVDPLDPYDRGAGIGAALSDELETDERAAQHTAATLGNRALPEFIVTGESPRKDEAFEPLDSTTVTRLQEMLDSRFGGPRNAGKTFVSRAPLNIHKLTPSFAELSLRDLREFEVEMLCYGFGFPPELLGKLDDSNRATIETAELLFSKHVVLPRVMAQHAAVTDQIVPQFGEGLRLCHSNPVDEDRQLVASMMTDNPDAFLIDEVRDVANVEPLPDGAGRRLRADMRRDYREPEPVEIETRAAAAPLQKMVRKADEDDIEDIAGGIPEEVFVAALIPEMAGAGAQFAEDALREVGTQVSFDLFDDRIRALIEERAAASSQLIVGTTREALRTTLGEGVALGENTPALVGRIRQAIGGNTALNRARMISRTEIVWSSNGSRLEAFAEAGVQEVEWLATFDDRVRDAHMALDGTVIRIGERFRIGDDTARHPGGFSRPENSINCRCTVMPRVAEAQTREWRARMWKALDDQRRPYERRLQAAVEGVFIELERQAVARMEAIQ